MRQNSTALLLAFVVSVVLASHSKGADRAEQAPGQQPQTVSSTAASWQASYIAQVGARYRAAFDRAQDMRLRIERFIAEPSGANLELAKKAWAVARKAYGPTEAFRFYGGPIDFVDPQAGTSGPELRLNSWPIDERFIDYISAAPDSGFLADSEVPLDRGTLVEKNAAGADTEVTLGYHAIEFMLWGEDRSTEGPGARPWTDYEGDDPIATRRRAYLKQVAALLVIDLEYLLEAWLINEPKSYAQEFAALRPVDAVEKAMTGLVQLAGFEMALERLAVALDSGDQEDEHSCFSDLTYYDFVWNFEGLRDVYIGRADYGSDQSIGISAWMAEVDPQMDKLIRTRLEQVEQQIAGLADPFDQMLAAEPDSASRKHAEVLVSMLQQLGELLDLARSTLVASSAGKS